MATEKLSEHIVGSPCMILTGAGASVPLGLSATVQFVEYLMGSLPGKLVEEVFNPALESCKPHRYMEAVDVEVIIDHINSCLDAADVLRADIRLGKRLFGTNPPAEKFESELGLYTRLRESIFDMVIQHYSAVDNPDQAAALYEPLLVGLQDELNTTVPIFTLNYDVAVETAADQLGLYLADGFDRTKLVRSWSRETFDTHGERGHPFAVLFKLHGSVSWCRRPDGTIVEVQGTARNPAPLEHVILYPSLGKKELLQEPFKTAYDYFSACLSQAKVLVVIGTTLRDVELVDTIRTGFLENDNLRLMYLGPSAKHQHIAEITGVSPNRTLGLKGKLGERKVGEDLSQIVSAYVNGLRTLNWGATLELSAARRKKRAG